MIPASHLRSFHKSAICKHIPPPSRRTLWKSKMQSQQGFLRHSTISSQIVSTPWQQESNSKGVRVSELRPFRWGPLALSVAAASLCLVTNSNEEHEDANVVYAAEKKTVTTMRGLIPQFAKVQDALKSVGYKEANNFPQIVVVGVQSSGKSSVLENIVGEEFLPKGEGTVTKRPIILTLHNTSSTGEKFAVLPDLANHRITDFKQLEAKIADQNSRFTDAPLRVDIYSPHVVDLRLVDLPGLIHNPTVKQPQDMRERIKDMCKTYIDNNNTVILCISPANSDLQTSEALRFCRKFDEKGERTISVLTKLDLVQQADVHPLMETLNQLPLKLGYVGVKCRSKTELVAGVDIQEALVREQEFFNLNPQFNRAGIKTGTTDLANQLSGMLQRQVEKSLPGIVEKVRIDLRNARNQLSQMGGPVPKSDREKNEVLLQELSKYLKVFLGASTIDNIKVEIAQAIYTAVYQECQKSLTNFQVSFNEQTKRIKNLPSDTPTFWEGQEDIRFQRWRENILILVDKLTSLSDVLTYQVVELIREKIDPSIKVIESRPMLHDTVKHLTMKYLNGNYEETVGHIKYLVSLEKNISYNSKAIEEKYAQVVSAKGGVLSKDELKKTGSGILSGLGWGSSSDANPFKTESAKYGQIWTETYLLYLSERLATNIYNSLCVEILDQLKDNLQKSFTVELVGSVHKDDLLRETPAVEARRKELEAQATELDKAVVTLSQILSRK